MIDRVIRKSFLFLRPAGLAVGLARKEPRLLRIHRRIRPRENGSPAPRLSGLRGLGVEKYTKSPPGMSRPRKPTPLRGRPGNVRAVHTRRKTRLSAVALIAGLALAGCGGTTELISGPGPDIGVKSKTPQAGQKLGFPAVATKNTTRVAGGDPVADAAGVALATYPARTEESKPTAVILAEVRDWRTGLAASVLAAKPIRAPLLFADGDKIPDATKAALEALQPTGAKEAGGAQVIRVGTNAPVEGYKTTDVSGANPAALAAAVDRLQTAAAGGASGAVVVANL